MQSASVLPRKERYPEIDLLKFMAIIFMIFVHTYEFNTYDAFFESPGYENPVLYALNFLIEFLGGAPAAPVFMFCMGLGITFSQNAAPSKLLKRGGILLLAGLLVNFLEEILPLVWEVESFEEILEAFPGLFANDVYFFFGLTFFFFSFAMAVKKPALVCGIACALSLIGGFFLPYLDFCTENTALNLILGLFVRTDEYAFFPFTSWIVFPTVGYLFGKLFVKTEDRKKLYRRSAILAAVVLILVTVVGLSLGYENSMLNALDCEDADYYAPNFFSQLWGLSFVVLLAAAAYWITGKMKEGRLTALITWGSKNVMTLYILQWLVIAILAPVVCLSSNIFYTYLICAVVTVLTYFATKLYLKLNRRGTKLPA